jgi:pimeloyl-ACP methyl ester carboxylesterase
MAVPLEIVHGSLDTIVPAEVHSVPLSRLVPGARLTLLEGAGHMPHHTHPEAVVAAIGRGAGPRRALMPTRRAVLAGGAAFLGSGAALTGWRAGARERAADAAFRPEGTLLDVGGRRVHAITRGAGPDVVLLHGAMGTARDFTFGLVDLLALRHRVTAFDRPARASPTARTQPKTAPGGQWATRRGAQADLLRRAAREIGIVRPVVVGHSFGASTALAWALGDPEGTAALVTLAGIVVPWRGRATLSSASSPRRPAGAPRPPSRPPSHRGPCGAAIRSVFAPDPVPPGYAEWVGAPLSLRRRAVRATARQVAGLKADLQPLAPRYGELSLPSRSYRATPTPSRMGCSRPEASWTSCPTVA